MKVIHIITRIEKGGSSKNVLSSIRGLNNIDSYLIYGQSKFEEEILSIPEEKTFKIKNLIREISPLNDIITIFKIYKILKKIEPDILHTHTSKAGILGRLAGYLYKKNIDRNLLIVHTPHGHILYGYFGKIKTAFFVKIEKIIANITDYFIALTPAEKWESVAAGIGKPEKWEVIHSGIDFPDTRPDKKKSRKKIFIEENEFLIGTAGRFEKVKGMEIFVKAAIYFEKKYNPTNTRYILIGNGPLKEKLIKMVKKEGFEDKFIFEGYRENIYEYLSAMDLYVQASLNEGMGRTVIEAQFCGVPVIVSDACGLPNIIKNNQTGLIFKRNDFKELAEKINTFYSNKVILENFSSNAIKFIDETDSEGYRIFSSQAMNYKLSEFYYKIISLKN